VNTRGFSALFAFMDNYEFIAGCFDADGLHHAAAFAGAIAGRYIDITRPQAFRAMIRIAVAANQFAAIFAGKVFDCASEFFHFNPHPSASRTPAPQGGRKTLETQCAPVHFGQLIGFIDFILIHFAQSYHLSYVLWIISGGLCFFINLFDIRRDAGHFFVHFLDTLDY
jgi:hypothetical protein